jgi:hypothetical protein
MTVNEIPYEFVAQLGTMTWADIQFGLEHRLLKPNAAIQKAIEQLCNMGKAPIEILELAGRTETESVIDLVCLLAKKENQPLNEVKAKWLYFVLAWVFENRESLVDPLQIVEEIYSDFDYPPKIAPFVRYMPMDGRDLRNREQNEARLFDRWKAHLDDEKRRFA